MLLEAILLRWWGPHDRADGKVLKEGNRLAHPALLQWWTSVSKWSRPLVTLNRVVPLSDLRNRRGMVIFWIENQGDVVWGYEAWRDDSRVYFDLGDGWRDTGLDMDAFLFRMSLLELVASSKVTVGRMGAGPDALTGATAGLEELDIGTIGWLPQSSTLLYSEDRLVEVIPGFRESELFDVTIAFRDDTSRRQWMTAVGEPLGFRASEPRDGAAVMEAPPF